MTSARTWRPSSMPWRFSADSWASRVQTDWFEINASGQLALSPLSAREIENVQTLGGVAHSHVVTGPAFWHVHERELAPELIEATSAQVRHWTPILRTDPLEVSPASPIANAYPLTLPCGNEQLSAFMHGGAPSATRGVVIVVAGGPQYRAGAHRQFVTMARRLNRRGLSDVAFRPARHGRQQRPICWIRGLGARHPVRDRRADVARTATS